MLDRSSIATIALAAVLAIATLGAQAHDEAKYPDWTGQWKRPGTGKGNAWDPTKPLGRGEQAPLTPEYQAIFEAGLADQAAGGQGTDPVYLCYPAGLPRGMIAIMPMQFIVRSDTTYIFAELFNYFRRLYRRPRLAGENYADLRGLFHRQVGRRGRRRPLRRARHRDPRPEKPPFLRLKRHSVPQGSACRDQGADLFRQGRPEHPA